MRVLVTGGAGFIGRHLVQRLLSEGHAVRVLDVLSSQVHGPDPPLPPGSSEADFVVKDVRIHGAVTAAVDDVDAVVHLAAETGVGQSMYEIHRYVDVNEGGTGLLLQALVDRRRPLQRLVLASSRAVYGEGTYECETCGRVDPSAREPDLDVEKDWNPCCPSCGAAISPCRTSEDAKLRPESIYAATKLSQEYLALLTCRSYGFPIAILRYFNVYGEGQSLSNPYTGILSAFHARMRVNQDIDVFEDGQESRDFIHVDDVVEATMRALAADPAQIRKVVFNVGSGQATTIIELARLVRDLGGSGSKIRITGSFRVGDVRHAVADPSRAAESLGFAATVPMNEGLERWLRWADRHQYEDRTASAAQELAERGLYRPKKRAK
jgi:dTDP-L-rhamnose 4-epimerase